MKRALLSYGLLICLLVATSELFAQTTTYERKSFVTESGTLPYRILYPKGFDENKSYPVLLFLHGSGERGSDNEKQLVHGSSLFTDDDFRNRYEVVVIFPQCPTESYWSNVDVVRNPGEELRLTFPIGGEPTAPMNQLITLMDSIQSLDYSLDDQFYVGGLSMGGMGTFEILYRRPEMFEAAFPICGGGNPNSIEEYADQVRIWVFHGAKDDVVLPDYSTEMVIALMKAGADVKYTLYKNANHNSWDSAFKEPDLMPWIFSTYKPKK